LSNTSKEKTTILQIPSPKTKRDILSFLWLTGYFRIWVPNYSIIAKTLYEAARGDPH
jgi:ribosomal protein S8